MQTLGRFLIVFGVLVVAVGVVLTFSRHVPWLGRLPGDFFFQKGSLRIYFPLVSCLLASLVITVVLNVLLRR